MMKQLALLTMGFILMLGLCACNQVVEKDVPTWQEQYDLGVRYLSEGDYEEAIIAFTAAIEIDPKQPLTYVGRGNAYIGSGDTEEILLAAQADYEKAIELDEILTEVYLGLAEVYIRQGEQDKALEILRQGLKKTENQALGDKLAELYTETKEDEAPYMDGSQGVGTVGQYDWKGDCTYEYNGKTVYITFSDRDLSETITYTMEALDHSVVAIAALGLDASFPGKESSLYVSDWFVTELDVNGRFLKDVTLDRNGRSTT